MQPNHFRNKEKLDSYSALIISKYLENFEDFINLICVNSKFKETTEKLRFNPIPITLLKLFPKIQTQYLYDEDDIKIVGIDNYEIWYCVDYDKYLKYKENNTKYHYVIYSHKNREKYGDEIPINATILGESCFGSTYYYGGDDASKIKHLSIPHTIKALYCKCFSYCTSLQSIYLPSTIIHIGFWCFNECKSLMSIELPSTIISLDESVFDQCISLTSINLPSSLTSIGDYCFRNCRSLTFIELPFLIDSLGQECFSRCSLLKSIIIPSSIREFGKYCFYGCKQLEGVIDVPDNCFYEPQIFEQFN
ncbi:Leucine rich repeat containing protein BspA family protein [Entamoeba marina]